MRIEYNKRKVLDKIYVYNLLFKKVSGYQKGALKFTFYCTYIKTLYFGMPYN